MTLQEIFDTVLAHMEVQGVQSKQGGKCLYRGPNGTTCAVGCLIKDEFYKFGLEDLAATSLQVIEATEKSIGEFSQRALLMLQDLQDVHDADYNWDESGFKGYLAMEDIAKEYGLVYKGVDYSNLVGV